MEKRARVARGPGYQCQLWLLLMLLQIPLMAQIAGLHTYEYLNLTQSARAAALGGYLPAMYADDDVNLMYSNPANIQDTMKSNLAISHSIHFAGVQHGFVSYGWGPVIDGISMGFLYKLRFICTY